MNNHHTRHRRHHGGRRHDHRRYRKPFLSGFFGFVFYTILSSIIFLLIYSAFFYPEKITGSYEIAKDKLSDFGDKNFNKVGNILKVNSYVNQESNECLKQINRKIEIAKEKSLIKLTTKIKEQESFTNTQDALSYLEDWEYIQPGSINRGVNSILFPVFYNSYNQGYSIKDLEDIQIVLVRVDGSLEGVKVGSLTPAICIGGELEQFNI